MVSVGLSFSLPVTHKYWVVYLDKFIRKPMYFQIVPNKSLAEADSIPWDVGLKIKLFANWPADSLSCIVKVPIEIHMTGL